MDQYLYAPDLAGREGDWASGALPRGLEGFENPVALGITDPSQCVPPLWFSLWSKLELN